MVNAPAVKTLYGLGMLANFLSNLCLLGLFLVTYLSYPLNSCLSLESLAANSVCTLTVSYTLHITCVAQTKAVVCIYPYCTGIRQTAHVLRRWKQPGCLVEGLPELGNVDYKYNWGEVVSNRGLVHRPLRVPIPSHHTQIKTNQATWHTHICKWNYFESPSSETPTNIANLCKMRVWEGVQSMNHVYLMLVSALHCSSLHGTP